MKNKNEIEQLKYENEQLKKGIEEISEDFEYAKVYYNNLLDELNYRRFVKNIINYIRKNGFFSFVWFTIKSFFRVFNVIGRRIKRKYQAHLHMKELREILRQNKGKRIMLFFPGYEWNMKMYQRPQHMAIHFSDKNVLFFYCTTNISDNIDGFYKVKDGLYVTNLYNTLRWKLKHYTLYLCANMNGCYKEEIRLIKSRGNDVLYEYIDDLHDDLTDISELLIERHKYVLKDSKIPVVITAQHLYEKAKKIRKSDKNLLLSTNGVVYEDFHITHKLSVPNNIKKIVDENKPIIGYYGALAKWFDYKLIEEVAEAHPNWNILLIGIDYDKSFAKYNYFKHLNNVYYIGTVKYKELIKYGNCCSVMTIPFLINEITLSTSPVKVFEYMSMEKPIVTTALPECKKYKSVLISNNHKEFISNLEKAMNLVDDNNYKKLLREEAIANTWDKKVAEILNFQSKQKK